ncbi:MAG: DinB family protein [Ferruginibacter sp.]
MEKIYKPVDGFPSFYEPYLNLVPNDGNLLQHLKEIQIETEILITALSEQQLSFSYSEGKWTIKDILVHMADCERVIIYRTMRIARGDKTVLPGFDEDLFAANAGAKQRRIDDILKELSIVRVASQVFIETLDDASLEMTGTANGYPLSVKLLVNHIYGHQRHHLNLIRERYLNTW